MSDAIIGIHHGHTPLLWAQHHRFHRTVVNIAGEAPVTTAVNSSRSQRPPAGNSTNTGDGPAAMACHSSSLTGCPATTYAPLREGRSMGRSGNAGTVTTTTAALAHCEPPPKPWRHGL